MLLSHEFLIATMDITAVSALVMVTILQNGVPCHWLDGGPQCVTGKIIARFTYESITTHDLTLASYPGLLIPPDPHQSDSCLSATCGLQIATLLLYKTP